MPWNMQNAWHRIINRMCPYHQEAHPHTMTVRCDNAIIAALTKYCEGPEAENPPLIFLLFLRRVDTQCYVSFKCAT